MPAAAQPSCPRRAPSPGQPQQPVKQLNLEIARRAETAETAERERATIGGRAERDDIMRAGHWEGLRPGYTGNRGSHNGNTEREREMVTELQKHRPGPGMVSY